MADRLHSKEAVCAKQKKVTEQILKNVTKGVKSPFLSPQRDQWNPNKKQRFLYFTHGTIPASLREIRPAVL